MNNNQLSYPRKKVKNTKGMTSNKIEIPHMSEEVVHILDKPTVTKWRLKNFTIKNIYYFFQAKYRRFITKQYNKFNTGLAARILEFEDCLGNHPKCGCPMVEILLSDKPFEKCHETIQ